MGTKYKEIELKFRAESIKLSDFLAWCEEQKPLSKVLASGYDYFYESKSDLNGFARHRVGPQFNQLTLKRKLTDKNNYIRTEHNVSLGMDATKDQVSAICEALGYKYNSTIFKNVFVYNFDRHIFVYYICYSEDLKEIGRFLEIEMSEEYPWKSEAQAWAELTDLERKLSVFGISPQSRVKKSLFEQFRKG